MAKSRTAKVTDTGLVRRQGYFSGTVRGGCPMSALGEEEDKKLSSLNLSMLSKWFSKIQASTKKLQIAGKTSTNGG